MGDHRFTIKIEMDFHGVKDKCDMNINFYDSGDGVDIAVKEFLQSVHARGMAKYEAEMAKYWAEQNKKFIEESEKVELDRLQKKYATK